MLTGLDRLGYLSYIKEGLGRDDPRNLLPPHVIENYITSSPKPKPKPQYVPLPYFGVPIPYYETMRDNMVHDSENYQLPQVQMTAPTQPPARSFVEDIPRIPQPSTYFKRTRGTGAAYRNADGTMSGMITPRGEVFRPPFMDQDEIRRVVLRHHRPRYSRSIRTTDVTEPDEMYAAVKNQLKHIDRRRRSRDQEIALKKGWISEQKEDPDIQQQLYERLYHQYERLHRQYDQSRFDDAPLLSSRRSDGSEYSYAELSPRHDNQVSLDHSAPSQYDWR
tara:strand:- start:37 stop:867 length:831 start_codon:yes stop_codon:yes gene_type:complete